jgi:hypothetical protein
LLTLRTGYLTGKIRTNVLDFFEQQPNNRNQSHTASSRLESFAVFLSTVRFLLLTGSLFLTRCSHELCCSRSSFVFSGSVFSAGDRPASVRNGNILFAKEIVEPATPAAGVVQETKQKADAVERSMSEDEIAAYLEKLLSKDFPLPNHYKAHLEAEARIKAALSKKNEIDFKDMPLTEVVQFFREELDVNIQLDMKVLEEIPVDTSGIVTAHAADITARSALGFVLNNLEEPLTWTVKHEMLLITTLDEADIDMTTKFYDVTDLVVVRGENHELSLDYDQLKNVIRSGCDQETLWFDEDGGEGGTIKPFEAVGIHGLAIRQTRQVHDEIELILSGLRRLRRKEPAIIRKVNRFPIKIKRTPIKPPQSGGGTGPFSGGPGI